LKFFEKDEITWTGKIELHDFYKTLLNLHAGNPALRAGDLSVETIRLKTSHDDHILCYLRKGGDNEVLVILNFSKFDFDFSIDDTIDGRFKEIFSCKQRDLSSDKNFQMKAWEYLVLEKN